MSDALMGKTEVDAVSAELISSIVQDYLHQEAKLLATVLDFSSLAGPGMDKIKIPKMGGFTVGDKAENTAVDAQTLTYTTDDMDLNKHKVIQWVLEKIAGLQATPSVLQDMAMRAAFDIARQLDKDIITALKLTSASAPDHRIAYTGSSGAAIAKADILSARTLLNKQFVPMSDRYLAIAPDTEATILGIDDFIHADKYGTADSLKSGELGRIYGFTVIMHGDVAALESVAYHKSHVAVAIQQGLVYDTQKDLANLGNRHSFDQIYGVKTLDSGKRGVLIGTAS